VQNGQLAVYLSCFCRLTLEVWERRFSRHFVCIKYRIRVI